MSDTPNTPAVQTAQAAVSSGASFQQARDPLTGTISTTTILYTDANGRVWAVPQGHRFWALYQRWLAAGNTTVAAASSATVTSATT